MTCLSNLAWYALSLVNVCDMHAGGVLSSSSKRAPPCQQDYKRKFVKMCGVVTTLLKIALIALYGAILFYMSIIA